jgi:hypothetical protein
MANSLGRADYAETVSQVIDVLPSFSDVKKRRPFPESIARSTPDCRKKRHVVMRLLA